MWIRWTFGSSPEFPMTRHRGCRSWSWVALALAVLMVPAGPAVAEDTPPVEVEVEGISDALLDNVMAFLRIANLREGEQPSETRVRWLHGQAPDEIRRALQPFGYYLPEVDASLLQDGVRWTAVYTVRAGERVRVRQVDIAITGAGADDPPYRRIRDDPPLNAGDVLEHARYEAIKDALQAVAADRGYFQGRLLEHRVSVDMRDYAADVIVRYDTGPRYQLGEVTFGPSALNEDFLRRYVGIRPGQPYRTDHLLSLQSDLIASEYFDQVTVHTSPDQAVDTTLPVTVDLSMRPRNRYTFGLGYGTDTGARGRAGFERRWVNRRGHIARADLLLSQIRQSLIGEYTIPGRDPRTDRYVLHTGIRAEDSDTKDSLTAIVGGRQVRRMGKWTRTLSLDYQWEQFELGDDRTETRLLMPGIAWSRVDADDPLFVTRGYRLDVGLRGAYDSLLSDVSFVQAWARSKWVLPLWQDGRLLLRGDAGTTVLAASEDFQRIPTSLRYYAGGDNSVRGYALDSIGPRNAAGDVVGGKHLLVGSVEYEHQLADKWSVAAFLDTGSAFDDEAPDFKSGVGLGVRWRSPVGPVRVDLAHGLNDPGDTVRLHLTIGPDL